MRQRKDAGNENAKIFHSKTLLHHHHQYFESYSRKIQFHLNKICILYLVKKLSHDVKPLFPDLKYKTLTLEKATR